MKNNFFLALTFAGFIALSLSSGFATDSSHKAPTVPDVLKVSASNSLLFSVKAKGVQIYVCQAKKEAPTQFEWVFVAPEADLFDDKGTKMGHHFAGPTWESVDGSQVVGDVKGKLASPDKDAVPWLMLSAKRNVGTGIFSHVTFIQRLETVGGKAPTGTASQANAGTKIQVPYAANYYFYGTK